MLFYCTRACIYVRMCALVMNLCVYKNNETHPVLRGRASLLQFCKNPIIIVFSGGLRHMRVSFSLVCITQANKFFLLLGIGLVGQTRSQRLCLCYNLFQLWESRNVAADVLFLVDTLQNWLKVRWNAVAECTESIDIFSTEELNELLVDTMNAEKVCNVGHFQEDLVIDTGFS